MKTVFRILAVAFLGMVMAGCHPVGDAAAGAPALQLRLYSVPAAQSRMIAEDLGAVLESAAFRVGAEANTGMRVTQPFPGTVMVLAPAALQPSIGSVITELAKASGKPSGGESAATALQVHFWLVNAIPGQGEDSPALEPLSTALGRLATSLGPSHFTLEAAVSAAGTMGQAGQLNGNATGQFNFKATPGQVHAINLWVAYDDSRRASGFGDVTTTVAAEPGEYVVVAQTTALRTTSGRKLETTGKGETRLTLFDDQGMPLDDQSRAIMRLLVVRVDRPATTSH